MRVRSVAWAAAVAAAVFAWAPGGPAAGADFPSRPLRLLVPSPPGGGNDLLARLWGGRLAELLNQQIVVENRAGGGGVIATDMTAKAPADGYTLLLGFIGPLAISPHLSR